MDDSRFDELTRSLARLTSRHQVIKPQLLAVRAAKVQQVEGYFDRLSILE